MTQERARIARQIFFDGDDPLAIKRKRQDEARAETACSKVLPNASSIFTRKPGTTQKHKQQWKNLLKIYAYPSLRS